MSADKAFARPATSFASLAVLDRLARMGASFLMFARIPKPRFKRRFAPIAGEIVRFVPAIVDELLSPSPLPRSRYPNLRSVEKACRCKETGLVTTTGPVLHSVVSGTTGIDYGDYPGFHCEANLGSYSIAVFAYRRRPLRVILD